MHVIILKFKSAYNYIFRKIALNIKNMKSLKIEYFKINQESNIRISIIIVISFKNNLMGSCCSSNKGTKRGES